MKKVSCILTILLIMVITSNVYGKDRKAPTAAKDNCAKLASRVFELEEEIKAMKLHNPKAAEMPKLTVTGAVIGKKLHTSALGKKIKPGECAISQDLAGWLNKEIYIANAIDPKSGKKLAPIGKVYVACIMPWGAKKKVDVYVTSAKKAYSITGVRPVAILR